MKSFSRSRKSKRSRKPAVASVAALATPATTATWFVRSRASFVRRVRTACTKSWSTTVRVAAFVLRNARRVVWKECRSSISTPAWFAWIRHLPSARGCMVGKPKSSLAWRAVRRRRSRYGNRNYRKEKNRSHQRMRGLGASGEVRRRRRHYRLSDPALHRHDDGPRADGGQRRTRCRVHRCRQRAFAAQHRTWRVLERRARVHRQLRRRGAVRLRPVFADLRQPYARADDDCRPHAGPAGRLRLGAYRRVVDPRHGLADGLVVRCAGGFRQSFDGLSHRGGPPRAPAPDGLPGRLFRFPHYYGCRVARSRAGAGIPAAL